MSAWVIAVAVVSVVAGVICASVHIRYGFKRAALVALPITVIVGMAIIIYVGIANK